VFWCQRSLQLPPLPRGFHLITRHVVEAVPEVQRLRCGLLHLFLQHTSASLTINENADPDVQIDLESSFRAIVPDEFPYEHDLEGPDDMSGHVKSSVLGVSLTIPVADGELALGTWQGVYLCEHRQRGGPRRLLLTLHGQE